MITYNQPPISRSGRVVASFELCPSHRLTPMGLETEAIFFVAGWVQTFRKGVCLLCGTDEIYNSP